VDLRSRMNTGPLGSVLVLVLGRLAALVAATTVLLGLLRSAPGDAVDLITVDADLRARISASWQLEAPLHEAVARALRGQWGTSWTVRPGRPVAELIGAATMESLPLLAFAAALTIGLGVLIGSRRLRPVVPIPSVMPVFLLGWGAIVALNELTFAGMQAGWFARPAWFSLPDTDSWLRFVLAGAVLAFGSGNLRAFAEQVRSRAEVHRSSAAIEALEARGMPTRTTIWRLLLPDLAGVTAERAALVFGGLVLVERVFAMPGLGSLFFEACVQRDQPLVLASGVVAAASVIVSRTVADALRYLADPRLRSAA